MIRTETEYRKTVERVLTLERQLVVQQETFETQGLDLETVTLALDPERRFLENLREEIAKYEDLKRGRLGTLYHLRDLGRWLIGVRLARGLSQKDLAALLGVSEAQVSRDERNEYHGITLERAQSLLERMGVQYRIEEGVSPSAPQSADLPPHPTWESAPPPLPSIQAYLRANRRLSPSKADQLSQLIQQAITLAETDSEEGLSKR